MAKRVAVQGETAIRTKRATSNGVGVVARGFPWDQHVEGIHAAAEEDANERLVVQRTGLGGDVIGEAQIDKRVEDCGRANSGAIDLTKETAA